MARIWAIVAVVALLSASIGTGTPAVVAQTPAMLPVIFIPGISGTSIVDYADNSTLWPSLYSSSKIAKLSLYPADHPSSQVQPSAAIQYVFGIEAIYGPLFSAFESAGYPIYQTGGLVSKQTVAGCDTSQSANKPLFFPFAYDWRIDNATNGALLAQYIGCIQKFYPGTKVNVMTHSMGGLVARSHILQSGASSNINALITVAGPWLGGPKVPYILQTGDWVDIIPASALKKVAGSFNAVAQLLASSTYFSVTAALQPSPIVQDAYCLASGATNCTGPLTPTAYVSALNSAYGQQGFLPGSTGQVYHSASVSGTNNSIDDWRGDTSGVKYYHIVGVQAAVATPTQVKYTCWITLRGECWWLETTMNYTQGDGTVPWLSALRYTAESGGTVGAPDYNAPNATIWMFVSPSTSQDSQYEHTGLVSKNTQVLNCAIQTFTTGSAGSSCPPALLRPTADRTSALQAPVTGDAHYVLIRNAASVVIADADSQTGPHVDSVASLPAVATYEDIHTDFAALSAAGVYTVTIAAGPEPLFVEVRTGTDKTTNKVLRYQDLKLPVGTVTQLRISPTGAEWLHPAGGGAALAPSYEGASNDREGPRTSIAVQTGPAGPQVTISTSGESPVSGTWYSIDGGAWQPYGGPVDLPPGARFLNAFAENVVAQRSPIVERQLLWTAFLPSAPNASAPVP
ncbi:MAG: hypothetical protein U0556_03285 [Dehalococcoidia bacterium]